MPHGSEKSHRSGIADVGTDRIHLAHARYLEEVFGESTVQQTHDVVAGDLSYEPPSVIDNRHRFDILLECTERRLLGIVILVRSQGRTVHIGSNGLGILLGKDLMNRENTDQLSIGIENVQVANGIE